MAKIRFTKMNGCGNDFVVIDARNGGVPADLPAWTKRACDRRFGIGADGVLVIGSDRSADFNLRIINSDGSEAEMCGNGARCAALFARQHGVPQKMRFTTLAGVIQAEATDHTATIGLTEPKDYRAGIALEALGQKLTAHFVNTGVPHAVIFVENIETVDVDNLGRAVRTHEAFKPKGTNVDFVQAISTDTIRMRTYERGVEAETFACGTGATASAIISARLKGARPPINVRVPGGLLIVDFSDDGKAVRDVRLSGDTQVVFDGETAI